MATKSNAVYDVTTSLVNFSMHLGGFGSVTKQLTYNLPEFNISGLKYTFSKFVVP